MLIMVRYLTFRVVIFGGAPDGYVWHKIAISSAETSVRLLAAAWVISLF